MTKRLSVLLVSFAAWALLVPSTFGFNLLQPGDAIIAIHDGDSIVGESNYPAAENPPLGLDGNFDTKYLNFGRENSGFILDLPSAITPLSFRMTAANDSPERDPISWEIFGFNGIVTEVDNGTGLADPWVSIASGSDTGLLADPGRFGPGTLQSFTNTTAYDSFKMLFPTVRDSENANSMQFADVLFYSDTAGTTLLNGTVTPTSVLAIDPDFLPASNSSYPEAEAPANAIDNNVDTKYLNFGGPSSGFIVTPVIGGAPFDTVRFTSANDAPGRNPSTFELYGTNEPITSADNSAGDLENWTLIDTGNTGLDENTAAFTQGPSVTITNPAAYSSYRLLFPELSGEGLMQIAEVEFIVPDVVALEVNRDTGEVRIVAEQSLSFASYNVESLDSGAINDAGWSSIASTNADPNDTWQETSTAGDRSSLAEADVSGSGSDDGFTLTAGNAYSLGTIWDRVPEDLQDMRILLLDTTGTAIPANVTYVGSEVTPGDYTGDGSVSIADWPQFRAGYGGDLTGLTPAEAYLSGDLDGDFDSDIDDYALFVGAAGGFQALFGVPEPASLPMFAGMGILLLGSRSVRRRLRQLRNLRGLGKCLPTICIAAIGLLGLNVDNVHAATGLNFSVSGGVPTFSIPTNETNEGGTVGDAATGSGPANLFDDQFATPLESSLFFTDYATEEPPAGAVSLQYASIGDEDADMVWDSKTFFMDYGSSVSPNWFAYSPRLGGDALADRVGQFEFWFSDTSFNQTVPTSAPDATYSILDTDGRLLDNVFRPYPLGDTQSGQHVAVRLTLSGTSQARPANNPGGHEFRLMSGASAPVIEVDRSTGEITLKNTGDANAPLDLQSYTIESPNGGLDATGFNGLGGDAGFPAGNGTGNGWEVGGGSYSGRLAEAHFLTNSTLSAGNAGLSLGDAYNVGKNTEDLVFKWTTGGSDTVTHIFDGIVEYVGTPMPSLRCDADGDMDCQVDDLDALYDAAGTANTDFDFDGNGTVGPEDLAGWLAVASTTDNLANPDGKTYVIGDLNLDGSVLSPDLGLLLNNFNSVAGSAGAGVGWGGGDLTMDGSVLSPDLGQLLNNFNFTSAAAAAVPEPASHGLVLLAVAGLLFTARRK